MELNQLHCLTRDFDVDTLTNVDTASASVMSYFIFAPSSPGASAGSHTFHSSKEILGRLVVFRWIQARSMRESTILMAFSLVFRKSLADSHWSQDVRLTQLEERRLRQRGSYVRSVQDFQ